MPSGNPVYNLQPTMPPGLSAIPYMLAGPVAAMTGGVAHPYVAPNMSVADAWIAKHVNDPGYRSMVAHHNGQLGYSLMATAGGIEAVRSISGMTGMSVDEMRQKMNAFGSNFGRSQVGSVVMPLVDTVLAQTGISGGRFGGVVDEMYANRMHMLSPGTLYNPFDTLQQSRALSGASAMAGLINGVISRTDNDGNILPMTNPAATQGFDRARVASIAGRMLRAGAFDDRTTGASFSDRMRMAADGFDIGRLEYSAGDYTGGGERSNLGKDAAEKVKTLSRELSQRLQGGVQAVGALRDMLNEVDGLEEKLDALTNGNWAKSGRGAYAARDAVRRLDALTKVYNLDPRQTLERVAENRFNLQNAAGFGDSMRYFGFDGGGLFGLSAQTSLIANVEDMISARGLQGDPIASSRLRRQAGQVMAQNMNTWAGRSAQLLAYGRQLGVIDEAEADRFKTGLQSGDRAVMGDTINRLLVTMFGSKDAGRRYMNDQMYVNNMRQSLSDASGDYAMNIMMRGADKEFMQREGITAVNNRLAFSRTALAATGQILRQSDADVDRTVDKVAASIRAMPGGAAYADAFKDQVAAMVGNGADKRAALRTIMASYKNNPATAMYAEVMDTAAKEQTAQNNEDRLFASGSLEGQQATALVKSLRASRRISGTQAAEIRRLVRSGNGSAALASANAIVSGLSTSEQKLYAGVKADAERKYQSALDTVNDKREVGAMIEHAGRSGFSSKAIFDAYNELIQAGKTYTESWKGMWALDDFEEAVNKSQIGRIFGQGFVDEFKSNMLGSDSKEYLAKMGRLATTLQQVGTENLRANGFGLHVNGFFGAGAYAGNSPEAAKARDQVIRNIASRVQKSSVIDAKDRSSFSQNFVDFLLGDGDYRSLLGVYDKGKALTGSLQDFGQAYDEFNASKEEYAKYEKGYAKIMRDLEGSTKQTLDKSMTSRKWLKYLEKNTTGMSDESLLLLVQNADLETNDTQLVYDALRTKRDMESKQASVQYEAERAAGDEETQRQYLALKANQQAAEENRSQFDAVEQYMKTLDAESMGSAGGKLGKAYSKMADLISEKEVSAANKGADYDLLSDETRNKTRMRLTAERAKAGDAEAMKVMSKFSAAMNEGTARISGEIVLKNGNDQSPASLSGFVGGLSQ